MKFLQHNFGSNQGVAGVSLIFQHSPEGKIDVPDKSPVLEDVKGELAEFKNIFEEFQDLDGKIGYKNASLLKKIKFAIAKLFNPNSLDTEYKYKNDSKIRKELRSVKIDNEKVFKEIKNLIDLVEINIQKELAEYADPIIKNYKANEVARKEFEKAKKGHETAKKLGEKTEKKATKENLKNAKKRYKETYKTLENSVKNIKEPLEKRLNALQQLHTKNKDILRFVENQHKVRSELVTIRKNALDLAKELGDQNLIDKRGLSLNEATKLQEEAKLAVINAQDLVNESRKVVTEFERAVTLLTPKDLEKSKAILANAQSVRSDETERALGKEDADRYKEQREFSALENKYNKALEELDDAKNVPYPNRPIAKKRLENAKKEVQNIVETFKEMYTTFTEQAVETKIRLETQKIKDKEALKNEKTAFNEDLQNIIGALKDNINASKEEGLVSDAASEMALKEANKLLAKTSRIDSLVTAKEIGYAVKKINENNLNIILTAETLVTAINNFNNSTERVNTHKEEVNKEAAEYKKLDIGLNGKPLRDKNIIEKINAEINQRINENETFNRLKRSIDEALKKGIDLQSIRQDILSNPTIQRALNNAWINSKIESGTDLLNETFKNQPSLLSSLKNINLAEEIDAIILQKINPRPTSSKTSIENQSNITLSPQYNNQNTPYKPTQPTYNSQPSNSQNTNYQNEYIPTNNQEASKAQEALKNHDLLSNLQNLPTNHIFWTLETKHFKEFQEDVNNPDINIINFVKIGYENTNQLKKWIISTEGNQFIHGSQKNIQEFFTNPKSTTSNNVDSVQNETNNAPNTQETDINSDPETVQENISFQEKLKALGLGSLTNLAMDHKVFTHSVSDVKAMINSNWYNAEYTMALTTTQKRSLNRWFTTDKYGKAFLESNSRQLGEWIKALDKEDLKQHNETIQETWAKKLTKLGLGRLRNLDENHELWANSKADIQQMKNNPDITNGLISSLNSNESNIFKTWLNSNIGEQFLNSSNVTLDAWIKSNPNIDLSAKTQAEEAQEKAEKWRDNLNKLGLSQFIHRSADNDMWKTPIHILKGIKGNAYNGFMELGIRDSQNLHAWLNSNIGEQFLKSGTINIDAWIKSNPNIDLRAKTQAEEAQEKAEKWREKLSPLGLENLCHLKETDSFWHQNRATLTQLRNNNGINFRTQSQKTDLKNWLETNAGKQFFDSGKPTLHAWLKTKPMLNEPIKNNTEVQKEKQKKWNDHLDKKGMSSLKGIPYDDQIWNYNLAEIKKIKQANKLKSADAARLKANGDKFIEWLTTNENANHFIDSNKYKTLQAWIEGNDQIKNNPENYDVNWQENLDEIGLTELSDIDRNKAFWRLNKTTLKTIKNGSYLDNLDFAIRIGPFKNYPALKKWLNGNEGINFLNDTRYKNLYEYISKDLSKQNNQAKDNKDIFFNYEDEQNSQVESYCLADDTEVYKETFSKFYKKHDISEKVFNKIRRISTKSLKHLVAKYSTAANKESKAWNTLAKSIGLDSAKDLQKISDLMLSGDITRTINNGDNLTAYLNVKLKENTHKKLKEYGLHKGSYNHFDLSEAPTNEDQGISIYKMITENPEILKKGKLKEGFRSLLNINDKYWKRNNFKLNNKNIQTFIDHCGTYEINVFDRGRNFDNDLETFKDDGNEFEVNGSGVFNDYEFKSVASFFNWMETGRK